MGKSTLVNGRKYREAPPSVLARVLARRRSVTAEGCWQWQGTLDHGYGIVRYTPAGARQVQLRVHRLVYMALVGDPGDGVPLDHLCHRRGECTVPAGECPHRRCFNPAHLEPSTVGANAARGNTPSGDNAAKDRCDYGHEFTQENTRWYRGQRRCRACNRRRRAEWIAARRAGRACERCGADISDRSLRARYCVECNPPTWRPRGKGVMESGQQGHADGGTACDAAKVGRDAGT